MAWYLNKYECSECNTYWEDEWSCMCDDECPNCGSSDHSPVNSEDISAFIEMPRAAIYAIYYSPPEAEHKPNFRILATVTDRNLALSLKYVAFEISKPQ